MKWFVKMIIDGKAIASRRLEILRNRIQNLSLKPKLAVVLVGNDPASVLYVKIKTKKAAEVGIQTVAYRLSNQSKKEEIAGVIKKLNGDKNIHGIIVQLPLPPGLHPDTEEILAGIDPAKDVDGLTGKSGFLLATVKAVLVILEEVLKFGLGGKVIMVVGQGRLAGRPLADYLEKHGARVNRCDEYTGKEQIRKLGREANILVSATGVPNIIKADMVKPGAVVIDCGSPKAEVDFENVKNVAGAITPVPGGVGPLTVVSLLENVVEAVVNNSHRSSFILSHSF